MSNSMYMVRRNYRGKLLATASAAVLMTAYAGVEGARAADGDRPQVWIDLGWHYERINTLGDIFKPPFLVTTPRPDFEHQPPLDVEKTLPWSYGGDGAISFQPDSSSWVFAAGVRYGRSHGLRHTHEQVASNFKITKGPLKGRYFPQTKKFTDATGSNSETHVVIDFQAGKDVGLGFLDNDSASVLSAGIRYVHFKSRSSSLLREDPDLRAFFPPPKYFPAIAYHNYVASADIGREFQGIGPSLSWKASAPLAGNLDGGELAFDWGIDGAVLFGRQRSVVKHETSGDYHKTGGKYHVHNHYHTSTNQVRSRRVTVPNVGGFAGISYRFTDAKLSIGYRADYFFKAVDGGIDTRHDTNRGFMGPYASISFGFGD